MKLVVDTNIVITEFWSGSAFNVLKNKVQLIAPELVLEEIQSYEADIKKKAGINQAGFDRERAFLAQNIEFIPIDGYKMQLKEAAAMAGHLPAERKGEFLEDVDFLALALKEGCPIWTHDKIFRLQERIIIFSTKEIIELLRAD